MAANSILSVYLAILLRKLCPTAIFVLNLRSSNQPSEQFRPLTASILLAINSVSQKPPPSVILFTNTDIDATLDSTSKWHMQGVLATSNTSRLLCLLLLTEDSAELHEHLIAMNQLQIPMDTLANSHLVLTPSSMLQHFNRYQLIEIIPTALIAVYEKFDNENQIIISLCQGTSCTASISTDLVPQQLPPDIRDTQFGRIEYWFPVQLKQSISCINELILVTALETAWNLCFDTSYYPERFGYKCGARDAKLVSNDPLASNVFMELELEFVSRRDNPVNPWRGVPWTRRSYVLIVPNWWHWRQPRSVYRMVEAVWAIGVSLLCWSMLVALRALYLQGCHMGGRLRFVVEMWARSLAVAVPETVASGRGTGIALATSALGMWNTMWLTGALFDLRFGGAEWCPVFETLDDVRTYGVGMEYIPMDILFHNHFYRWLKLERLLNNSRDGMTKNEVQSIFHYILLQTEGGVENFHYWQTRHAGNGSRAYRQLFDERLMFNVDALITPRYLRGQLLRVSRHMSEAGLNGHLIALQQAQQMRKRTRRDLFETDEQIGIVENAGTDPLISVTLIFASVLLGLTTTCFVFEVSVANREAIRNMYNTIVLDFP